MTDECRYCGGEIQLVQGYPLDTGPMWVHTVSGSSHCTLFATPAGPVPEEQTTSGSDESDACSCSCDGCESTGHCGVVYTGCRINQPQENT